MSGVGGDQSLQAQVRRALGPRTVVVSAAYVQKNGVVAPGTESHGVVREAYCFVRLDGKGAHCAGATQWRQTRILNEPDPYFWMCQHMMLLCECHWHGSSRPIADKQHDPQGYRLAVELQARVRAEQATQADTALLRKLVREDAYYDPYYEVDVRSELYALQLRAAEEMKAASEPAAADGGEVAPKSNKRTKTKHRTVNASVQPLAEAAAPPAVLLHFDDWDPLAEDPVPPRLLCAERDAIEAWRAAIELARQPGMAVEAAVDSESERRIREQVRQKISAPAAGTPKLLPKVEFSVCFVPSPSGGGLLCRFLIFDPNMDPGTFLIGPLLKDIRQRAESRLQGAGDRGRQQQVKERFPHYRSLYSGNNHPVSDRTSLQTYFKLVTALCPEYVQRYASRAEAYANMRPDQPTHATHPCNVLSLQRALRAMADTGCSLEHCNGNLWRNGASRPIVPSAESGLVMMTYMPDAVFWKNIYDVGLGEYYFPHVDAGDDFLAAAVAKEDLERFLPGNEAMPRTITAESRLYYENFRISRTAVISQQLLKYHTNNEHMHLAARAEIVNKRIQQEFPFHALDTYRRVARLGLRHPDVVKRVAEYERYRTFLRLAQDGSFLAYEALCPLEGDVSEVPISAPMQAVLKWYQNSKHPNLTREFVVVDMQLGMLGNSMLRALSIFTCIGRIVHPTICMLSEGLFSCYRYAPRELAFNIMAHGRYDVGKTYLLITMLIKLITIPGTVEEYTSESAAASTTENHVYDVIIASDEVMPWKVDSAEAKRNPVLVNQEKVKMVTQRVGRKVFVFVKTDDGEKVRWTRTIVSDHYGALVEVTNWEIEEKNALSSRYHTITVPLSKVPVREFTGPMAPSLSEDSKHYLHINQFLSALVYKAIQDGVLLDVDMRLWDDLSNRILTYLTDQNAISKDAGARGLAVMRPHAIQMVVHMAIRYAFDMPWSPNWKKPFEIKDVRAVQRYLYCTTEVVWWCWTAMACEWIQDTNARMIEAAVKSAGIKWSPGHSAYAMYERDLAGRIPFRMRSAPNHRGDKRGGEDLLIDLNYLAFEGSVEKVAEDIANGSKDAHISKVDVLGAINRLKAMRIPIVGGAMIPQPAEEFKRYHRYRVVPDHKNGVEGFKERGVPNTPMRIPDKYMISNQEQDVDRCEKDVPRYDESHLMAPVEVSQDGKWVYIMPCVAEQFKPDVIREALEYATVCKTMRPGKMLLGLAAEDNSMRLQVYECSRSTIAEMVVGLDAACDIVDGKWKQDPKKPLKQGQEIPISRTVGIPFPRRTVISKNDAKVLGAAPMRPTTDATREPAMQRMASEMATMSDLMEVIEDLDHHSALLQHLRCGLPLDEPVHDPQWIEDSFAASATPSSYTYQNYPDEWLPVHEERTRIWDSINETAPQAAYLQGRRRRATEPAAQLAPEPSAPAPEPQAPPPQPRHARPNASARLAEAERNANRNRQRDKRPLGQVIE